MHIYTYPSSISLDFDLYGTGYAVFLPTQTLACEVRGKTEIEHTIILIVYLHSSRISPTAFLQSPSAPCHGHMVGMMQHNWIAVYSPYTPLWCHAHAQWRKLSRDITVNCDLKFDSVSANIDNREGGGIGNACTYIWWRHGEWSPRHAPFTF